MHPWKAAIHSALFSPHSSTRSPGPHAPLFQQRRKPSRQPRQLAVGRRPPPIPLVANHCNIPAKSAEVVDDCGQVVSHPCSGNFMVSDSIASDSLWM
jgi:hypothetical protein